MINSMVAFLSEDLVSKLADLVILLIKFLQQKYKDKQEAQQQNYQLKRNELSEIYHTQLNPTISYLHEPGVRRFSLSLDIAEVFKPLIGDRLIFSLLNRKQITEDSFTKELNFLHLKKDASKLIVSELEKRLKQSVMHKDLGRQVSYQYLLRLESYKLIKHLIGEKEYEGFRIWW